MHRPPFKMYARTISIHIDPPKTSTSIMNLTRALALSLITLTATSCGPEPASTRDEDPPPVVLSPSGDMRTSEDMGLDLPDLDARDMSPDRADMRQRDMNAPDQSSPADMPDEVDMAPPMEATLADGIELVALYAYQTLSVDLLDPAAPIPLTANRDVLVRVQVATASGWREQEVNVVLTLASDTAPEKELAQTRRVTGAEDPSLRSSGFEFLVPASDITPSLRLAARIEGEGGVAVSGVAPHPARWPRQGELSEVTVDESTGTLEVVIVPFRYDYDGSGRMPDTSPEQMQKFQDALEALYPMVDVDFSVRAPISWDRRVDWGNFNTRLRSLKSDDGKEHAYYYGMISPDEDFNSYCSGRCTTGQSFTVSSASASSYRVGSGVGFSGDRWVWTFIHELGHMHGRGHAPCDVTWGADRGYPHAGGDTGAWGWDRRLDLIITPTSHTDFMGYCDTLFVSDYTYSGIAQRMREAHALRPLSAHKAPAKRYDMLGWSSSRAPSWKGSVMDRAPHTGEVARVTARDEAGASLGSFEAHIARMSHDGEAIALVEAIPAEAHSIELRLDSGESLVVRMDATERELERGR